MIHQRSPEWYELRKRKVGASDANVIMGVSPFKTPYQLWLEKMDFAESKETEAMRFGNDMEPLVRERFFKQTKIPVIPQVMFHMEHDWLMASLDGLSADGKTAVEIKCHRSPVDFEYVQETGQVPPKYYPQVQVQMEVVDVGSMFYMCFYQKDFILIEVERDQAYINEMIPKLKDFYDLMMEGVSPPLLDKDKELRTDDEFKSLEDEWITIQEQIEALKKREEFIRELLIEKTEGKNVQGEKVSIVKTFPKGRVDYSLIDELKQVDLNQYRKPSKEVWTIRKQKKECSSNGQG